ncbi:MAG: dethiobiotin synthase, partial [Pseudomonadota bacterium]|nr:dethiobiotin synthase [Pseudomonadota bacterium]
MSSFFITGTGTGIGKTLVMTALCRQLKASGKTVTALKPVISGYDPKDKNNDAALILKSCGLAPSPALMETIAPWRYAAPLSPSMAAAKENNPVDMQALVKFCRDHAALASDAVLAEGAGGVMSPLTENETMLDWMEALGWPAILVGGSYLGALSHMLSAFEALKSRGV